MTADTEFADDDHRSYNRHGEAFDVGETFAGVPFDVGLAAVDEIRDLVPVDGSMAQFALRWILAFAEVSTVIPGARNAEQAVVQCRGIVTRSDRRVDDDCGRRRVRTPREASCP